MTVMTAQTPVNIPGLGKRPAWMAGALAASVGFCVLVVFCKCKKRKQVGAGDVMPGAPSGLYNNWN